jgi:hypothetical protein
MRRVYTDPLDENSIYVQMTNTKLLKTDRTRTGDDGKLTWKLVTERSDSGEKLSRYRDPKFEKYLNWLLVQAEITVGEEWERDLRIRETLNPYRICQEDFEPPSWVVEGLIPENAITLLTGWRNSGKTWLALNLGKAVCEGSRFLGRHTEMMLVLYLNCDNSKKPSMERLRVLGLDGRKENFHYWPLWHKGGAPPKLDSDDSPYEEIARKCSPILIIFDSLQRFHSGDENNNKDMSALFEKFRRLTTLGATVLILHNTGRDAKLRPRGATAIDDGADVLLGLRTSGFPSKPNGATLSLAIQRDKVGGRDGEKLILKLSIQGDGNSIKRFSLKLRRHTTTARQEGLSERILAVVREYPDGISGRGIVKAVGGKTARVYREMERLREEGLVLTKRGPKRAMIYFPVDE